MRHIDKLDKLLHQSEKLCKPSGHTAAGEVSEYAGNYLLVHIISSGTISPK